MGWLYEGDVWRQRGGTGTEVYVNMEGRWTFHDLTY